MKDKMIIEKINKKTKVWHHDIRYVDGRFIEDVVNDFQKERDVDAREKILIAIIQNYSIFRTTWARAFAPFLENEIEAGQEMHDQIIWRSAEKFNREKCAKPNGKAFNAYVVSALLNQLKNLRNSKMSLKNSPRVKCPICKEEVYQIDHKHLRHRVDLERYKQTYPKHPLSSSDGKVMCPITGDWVEEITEPYINRVGDGAYSPEDFAAEFPELVPIYPLPCPYTGMEIKKMTADYPSFLAKDFSEQDFIETFPDFKGIITCPFTGKKMLEMTQQHIDEVLGRKYDPAKKISMSGFCKQYPNVTLKAKRVTVISPYDGKTVPALNKEVLGKVGMTVREHMERYMTIVLDRYYPQLVICPLTGKKTHMIRKMDIEKLGKSVADFYRASCEFPLYKYQVKNAITGDWVDNVWGDLEKNERSYATPMTPEAFESLYGTSYLKASVTTNSYVENDSGDVVHIGDLIPEGGVKGEEDLLEIEDSLLCVAQDDLDKRIAHAVRESSTLDDIFFKASEHTKIKLPEPFKAGMGKILRNIAKKELGAEDFDIGMPPAEGSKEFEVLVPSKKTVHAKLQRMISESDLNDKD